MLARDDIATLIPHQGSMCLLERVLQWDHENIVLSTMSHRWQDNPLAVNGRIRAVHLCEYGAQAMAVHGGLLARAEGRNADPGLLVSLRDVTFQCAYIESFSDTLIVSARRLHAGAASLQYQFHVKHRDDLLAAGRAMVMTESDV